MMATESNDLLKAALVGYRHELESIDAKMADIRSRLGTQAAAPGARAVGGSSHERMAAAQKKRWDAYRKQKAASAAKPAGESRISDAGKRRIIEATKKRWAEYRAKKAAAAKAAGKKGAAEQTA
jgi:hypothetical protein